MAAYIGSTYFSCLEKTVICSKPSQMLENIHYKALVETQTALPQEHSTATEQSSTSFACSLLVTSHSKWVLFQEWLFHIVMISGQQFFLLRNKENTTTTTPKSIFCRVLRSCCTHLKVQFFSEKQTVKIALRGSMFIVFLCFPAKCAQFTSWNMFYFAASPENSASKL